MQWLNWGTIHDNSSYIYIVILIKNMYDAFRDIPYALLGLLMEILVAVLVSLYLQCH